MQAEEDSLRLLWNRGVSRPPFDHLLLSVNLECACAATMTLRIDKTTSGDKTVIRFAGKLRREILGIVNKQIASCIGEVALDLTQLESASLEGVLFLNDCEDRGITVTGAPAYVLTWMNEERKTADESLC